MGTTDPVGAFLAGIEGAALPEDIFCEDIVLDATVPNWRFHVQGAGAVRDELREVVRRPWPFGGAATRRNRRRRAGGVHPQLARSGGASQMPPSPRIQAAW